MSLKILLVDDEPDVLTGYERVLRKRFSVETAPGGEQALALLERVGNDNAQKEFYLTDVVALARAAGQRAVVVLAPEDEVMGVNDRVQLAAAEAAMQNRLLNRSNDAVMVAGERPQSSRVREVRRQERE